MEGATRAEERAQDLADERRRHWRYKSRDELSRDVRDDVPFGFKRMIEGDSSENKRIKAETIAMVMATALEQGNRAHEWMSRDELKALRRVLNLPSITAVRAHREPCRKLQVLPAGAKEGSKKRARMSI